MLIRAPRPLAHALFASLLLVSAGCDVDENEGQTNDATTSADTTTSTDATTTSTTPDATSEDVADTRDVDTPPPTSFSCVASDAVPCSDQLAFFEIRRSGEVLAEAWKGHFDFAGWAKYVVVVDTSGNATRGYILKSGGWSGGTQLEMDVAQGLVVYRDDREMARAAQTENGLFDFYFGIDGTDFSMMLYTESDYQAMQDDSNPFQYQWINTLVHETFHAFQDTWTQPTDWIQDDAGYPRDRDVYALSLLESHIVIAASKTRDAAEHEALLKMFVAARTDKMQRDPSADKLVTTMDNPQEISEGTADYIEVKARELIDPTYPAHHYKHTFEDFVTLYLQDRDAADGFFTWGIWYQTGSSVLRMMDTVGADYVDMIESGMTPYAIARDHLALSTADLDAALESAKQRFDFAALEAEADRILAL